MGQRPQVRPPDMKLAIVLLPLTCCLVSAELPLNLIKKLSGGDYNLRQEMAEREMKSESLMEDLMMEKSMIMESCEVQRHVLSKLRDLVLIPSPRSSCAWLKVSRRR